MKKNRALEVGCGEGHVTRFLLENMFDQTDLLDQCPTSIAYARALKDEYPSKIGDITLTTMQEFNTTHKYNCIVLRWTLGYLCYYTASKVLKKLGQMLVENNNN